MLVSLDFDCLQVLSCYFCSSWRCWLAVEVRDKCVTKLPSFWREDRLLCSHSCFFSLSLFYTLSQFVWERFYTLFFFHIHKFIFLAFSLLSVKPSSSPAIYCVFLLSSLYFSPLSVDFIRSVLAASEITYSFTQSLFPIYTECHTMQIVVKEWIEISIGVFISCTLYIRVHYGYKRVSI